VFREQNALNLKLEVSKEHSEVIMTRIGGRRRNLRKLRKLLEIKSL
jgi:hypothetical protein